YPSSVEAVVAPPVVEVLTEPPAHPELVVGRDGDVAAVVEPVDIGAQEQPVRELVRATLGVRDDVASLERGEGVLPRDGALPIGRLQRKPERPLAEPRAYRPRCAVPVRRI